MEALITQAKQNQIILDGDKQYSYAINPFEITNPLGAPITTLQEYTISGLGGENYKIYKTKEGNWYDIAEVNSTQYNLLLISLKSAIDLKESGIQHFFKVHDQQFFFDFSPAIHCYSGTAPVCKPSPWYPFLSGVKFRPLYCFHVIKEPL